MQYSAGFFIIQSRGGRTSYLFPPRYELLKNSTRSPPRAHPYERLGQVADVHTDASEIRQRKKRRAASSGASVPLWMIHDYKAHLIISRTRNVCNNPGCLASTLCVKAAKSRRRISCGVQGGAKRSVLQRFLNFLIPNLETQKKEKHYTRNRNKLYRKQQVMQSSAHTYMKPLSPLHSLFTLVDFWLGFFCLNMRKTTLC